MAQCSESAADQGALPHSSKPLAAVAAAACDCEAGGRVSPLKRKKQEEYARHSRAAASGLTAAATLAAAASAVVCMSRERMLGLNKPVGA